MAKKKKADERTAEDIAMELLKVRAEKNALAAIDKTLTAALKERIHMGERQNGFKIISETKMSISDVTNALKWAKATAPHAITVDLKVARAIIQKTFTLPAGFQVKTSEKLVTLDGSDEDEE